MATKTEPPPLALQDHAATAALYVTKPKVGSGLPVADNHSKLSSAGAATSLKYAKPHELPSFPSSGGLKLSSASAAASLANSNQKSFEHWKPGALPAAERAAYLAKNYQAEPLWYPDMSTAGSKAALLAARDGANVEIWMPSEPDYGQSAAGQAAGAKKPTPVVDNSISSDSHHKALLAATGAMRGSRRRAESAPLKAPPVDNPWALMAATTSHRGAPSSSPSVEISDPALNASRIHNIAKFNVSRDMYTSNPPVSIEVEEKNRQDTLRASAVAMARKMYAVQQTAIDEAKLAEGLSRSDSHRAAVKSHNRRSSNTSRSSIASDEGVPAYPQYTNLQEAAKKLAQERLAKLENEHKLYRDYYAQNSTQRSRLSFRSGLRRRASSDGQLDKVDEEQSQKIRSQMSLFKSRIDEVDERKRFKDRTALLAAAQRNVAARMSVMDEKVYSETGKASPAMMQEWERKAKEKAEADSALRMENYGKVGIGGGRYLDQAQIDAVARSRLQPTFDELTSKAEAQRARDEELRLELEEKKRKAEVEKARETETKLAVKNAKERERNEERARKMDEKRLVKEEKKKPRDHKHRSFGAILGFGGAGAGVGAGAAAATAVVDKAPTLDPIPTTAPIPDPSSLGRPADTQSLSSTDSSLEDVPTHEPTPTDTSEIGPNQSTASPEKKSWFSRLRRVSRATKPVKEVDNTSPADPIAAGVEANPDLDSDSSSSSDETPGERSMRDVAMVGRPTTTSSIGMYSVSQERPTSGLRHRNPSISSLSSSSADESAGEIDTVPERGRSRRGLKDLILRKIHSKSSQDEDDEFQEARDTFEDATGKPSSLRHSANLDTREPGHSSRFSEEL